MKSDKKAKKPVKDNKKEKKEKIPSYDELMGKYKRALADYQNLIKRTEAEKQEFRIYANEQMIMEILPVYDNMRESLKHIDAEVKTNGWAEGIKYTIKQFKDALKSLGVEEIKAVGEEFDPRLMEAIEGKGEKVVKVIKFGYKLNGRVLIPAKVIVK
jgi:molecular chaperone GrpE